MSTTAPITNAADLQFEDGYPYKVTDNPGNKYQRFQRKDIIATLQRALVVNHNADPAEAVELSEDSNVYCLAPEGICAIYSGGGDYWFVDHTSRGVDLDGEDVGSEIFDPVDRETLSEFLNKL